MTLSELCIRRPVMTTLITASIIAFGVFRFPPAAVSALPRVRLPTINVTATLRAPALTPWRLRSPASSSVNSRPLPVSPRCRRARRRARRHHIQFDLNRNIDARTRRADRADDCATPAADRNTIPPSFRKVNPAGLPVLFVSLGLGDAAAVGGQRVMATSRSAGAVALPASRRSRSTARRNSQSRPGRSEAAAALGIVAR